MAWTVILSDFDFFNKPLQNKEEFISFYETETQKEAIQNYSSGLLKALEGNRQQFSILWTNPDSKFPSVRYFIKGNIKRDRFLKVRDIFLREEKEKILGSPNRADDSPDQQVVTM